MSRVVDMYTQPLTQDTLVGTQSQSTTQVPSQLQGPSATAPATTADRGKITAYFSIAHAAAPRPGAEASKGSKKVSKRDGPSSLESKKRAMAKKAKPSLTDEELRQYPFQAPSDRTLSTSAIKKWYRLKDREIATLPQRGKRDFKIGWQDGTSHGVNAECYLENDAELVAWRKHGGYHGFLSYLLKRKRIWDETSLYNSEDSEDSDDNMEFPLSQYYWRPLLEVEKKAKDAEEAAENTAAEQEERAETEDGTAHQEASGSGA